MCELDESYVAVVGTQVDVARLGQLVGQGLLAVRGEVSEPISTTFEAVRFAGDDSYRRPALQRWRPASLTGAAGTAAALQSLAVANRLNVVAEPGYWFALSASSAAGSGSAGSLGPASAGNQLQRATTEANNVVGNQGRTAIALIDSGNDSGDMWDCVGGEPQYVQVATDAIGHGTADNFLICQFGGSPHITNFRAFDSGMGTAIDGLAAVVVALWAHGQFGTFDQVVMPFFTPSKTCASNIGATLQWILDHYQTESGRPVPSLVAAVPNVGTPRLAYPALWNQALAIGSKDWNNQDNDYGGTATYRIYGGIDTDPVAWVGATPMHGTSMATALAAGALSL